MKRTKRPVRGGMKVRAYDVLRRAVEEGAAYGWRRAHKQTDAPGEDAIVDQIVQGVLNEVCEYFDVDDEDRPA
jgi:predicted Zn-dependent protease with MMP-like domain